ncbi:uncharacterized protein [Dermacentor albipictus]|uniref:uncharacterized protein n=1 Tax=Dermacentor albipictus TaxID=60249 RepID=UPI0031FCB599
MSGNRGKPACSQQSLQRSSTTVESSASEISGTRGSQDSASNADVEDHRGSISPLDYVARARDPAVGLHSPSPVRAGATWFHRYRRTPAALTGHCLLYSLAVLTLGSVACLAFMFIRHNEKVYAIVWSFMAELFGRIFREDGPC